MTDENVPADFKGARARSKALEERYDGRNRSGNE
jgi:hypothetical protein